MLEASTAKPRLTPRPKVTSIVYIFTPDERGVIVTRQRLKVLEPAIIQRSASSRSRRFPCSNKASSQRETLLNILFSKAQPSFNCPGNVSQCFQSFFSLFLEIIPLLYT